MINTIIQTIKSPQQEAFEAYIQTQKCPFRIYKRDGMEYMMECDPNCVALFTECDYSAYSCLRLMNSRYELDSPCFIAGIQTQEEEE